MQCFQRCALTASVRSSDTTKEGHLLFGEWGSAGRGGRAGGRKEEKTSGESDVFKGSGAHVQILPASFEFLKLLVWLRLAPGSLSPFRYPAGITAPPPQQRPPLAGGGGGRISRASKERDGPLSSPPWSRTRGGKVASRHLLAALRQPQTRPRQTEASFLFEQGFDRRRFI